MNGPDWCEDETRTVLIYSRRPIVRNGLRSIIRPSDGSRILEATEVGALLHLERAHSPSLILLDIGDARGRALDPHRLVAQFAKSSRIVVVSDRPVVPTMRVENMVLLTSYAPLDEYLSALGGPSVSGPESPCVLTRRQTEVLTLVANGHSNIEVGELLCLSARTVKRHLHNIYAQLRVSTRIGAINRAREAGLLV